MLHPISQHSTQSNIAHLHSRRNKNRLQEKLAQMRLTLAPIYPLPHGPPHPEYPKTLLQYWLLTESQLDSLAKYYHQTSPTNPWRVHYPASMNWDLDFLAAPDSAKMSKEEREACLSARDRLAIKRRMFGKFIGLRGCDTPVVEMEKRVKFMESRVERAIRRERDLMGRKWPFY